MKTNMNFKLILPILLLFTLSACYIKQKDVQKNTTANAKNEEMFKSVLLKHLSAVKNKDLTTLKSTMSPEGKMELIQPSSEIVYTVDGFMKFHEAWFALPDWTVKTKILSTDIGEKIGVATTEFYYEEPDRNGKPYFNRLIVTYTLEKINNTWYIIKDHASSVEKTYS